MRWGGSCVCILMACADASEADQVGRQLLKLNSGCLVTYRRAQDLMYNAPMGKVALVILGTNESSSTLGRILKWLRKRWPNCPLTVVGDNGGGEQELTARIGGALYLTRPVRAQQWSELLAHVLRLDDREVYIEGDRDLAARPTHDD